MGRTSKLQTSESDVILGQNFGGHSEGHLVTHSLINDSQHGFLPKTSCLINLLEFLEYGTTTVVQGSQLMLFISIFKRHSMKLHV